jgi:phytoene desaturase
MGPSWYLMPEVFEQFFDDLGKNRADYYSLKKLAPYYRVFFEDEGSVDIGPDRSGINAVFDGLEKKGSEKLEKYLKKASYKYKVAIEEFLYREYRSIFQFINPKITGLKKSWNMRWCSSATARQMHRRCTPS